MLQSHRRDAGATVESLRAFLNCRQQQIAAQLQVQQLRDHTAVASLVDSGAMVRREQQLRNAAASLQQIVEHSSTLALRLKDVNAKQTVSVEPEFQAKFSEMLMRAAEDTCALQQGGQHLHWANQFKEPPRVWERYLEPITAVNETFHAYHKKLNEMSAAMAQLAAGAGQPNSQPA